MPVSPKASCSPRHDLMQGLANCLCKRPVNKYFRFCGPCHLCRKDMVLAMDNTSGNECDCVPIKLYLWALKFEFIFHVSQNIIISIFLLLTLQGYKNCSELVGLIKAGSRADLALGHRLLIPRREKWVESEGEQCMPVEVVPSCRGDTRSD